MLNPAFCRAVIKDISCSVLGLHTHMIRFIWPHAYAVNAFLMIHPKEAVVERAQLYLSSVSPLMARIDCSVCQLSVHLY